MQGESVNADVILEASGLVFAYDQDRALTSKGASAQAEPAVQDVSLTACAGEIVCILGASGCGKSTLLNLIAGLIKPQIGKIKLSTQSDNSRSIGYIFQDDALLPWRSVEANLLLACELIASMTKESAGARIASYLDSFHLNREILKKYPSQLSGGMRQRVSIIQSLMFNPELILLDEPFSALDFYTKLRLESEFVQLVKSQRKAAILVTHDIEEAIAMSDRVLIMSRGGRIGRQFEIKLGGGDNRLPEDARGTPAFAEYYSQIWNELKAVISE